MLIDRRDLSMLEILAFKSFMAMFTISISIPILVSLVRSSFYIYSQLQRWTLSSINRAAFDLNHCVFHSSGLACFVVDGWRASFVGGDGVE